MHARVIDRSASGVNVVTHNQATLHTTPGCTMPSQFFLEPETGWVTHFLLHTGHEFLKVCCRKPVNSNCDTSVNFNAGCGVIFSDPIPSCTSYGAPFNKAGGGYFAMYRGTDSVKVWFFPRKGYVPNVIRKGAAQGTPVFPDLSWGLPAADFPFYPDYCDYEKHFDAHILVFDLTFCVSLLTRFLFCS